jgi:hypothetical protein
MLLYEIAIISCSPLGVLLGTCMRKPWSYTLWWGRVSYKQQQLVDINKATSVV